MPNRKIRIIYAEDKAVDMDILAVEEVPSVKAAEEKYLRKLQRLAKEKRATFQGRAVDEDSGVAYQIFSLPEDHGEKPGTIFIEDRPATNVISSLLDKEGQMRRIQIRKNEAKENEKKK